MLMQIVRSARAAWEINIARTLAASGSFQLAEEHLELAAFRMSATVPSDIVTADMNLLMAQIMLGLHRNDEAIVAAECAERILKSGRSGEKSADVEYMIKYGRYLRGFAEGVIGVLRQPVATPNHPKVSEHIYRRYPM